MSGLHENIRNLYILRQGAQILFFGLQVPWKTGKLEKIHQDLPKDSSRQI